jgi:hypothetical protein
MEWGSLKKKVDLHADETGSVEGGVVHHLIRT